MIRAFILSCIILMVTLPAWACDVCQANQPKALKGITHGTGPEGSWDYIIIWLAVIIVVGTLYLSVKYLVKPREENTEHIKYSVIENT